VPARRFGVPVSESADAGRATAELLECVLVRSEALEATRC
jgi:hypothetical protein